MKKIVCPTEKELKSAMDAAFTGWLKGSTLEAKLEGMIDSFVHSVLTEFAEKAIGLDSRWGREYEIRSGSKLEKLCNVRFDAAIREAVEKIVPEKLKLSKSQYATLRRKYDEYVEEYVQDALGGRAFERVEAEVDKMLSEAVAKGFADRGYSAPKEDSDA